MAHQRQVIRHYVRDLLTAGNTAACNRVTATRINPYRTGELPAISVYTLEDTVDQERSNTAPREYTRDLKLEIAGWVTPGDDVDDRMDDLALEIETLMDGDIYLGDNAADSMLEATAMGVRGEGDAIMGLVTLTYRVRYTNLAPEAPTGLSDFLTADVKYPTTDRTPTTVVPEDLVDVRAP